MSDKTAKARHTYKILIGWGLEVEVFTLVALQNLKQKRASPSEKQPKNTKLPIHTISKSFVLIPLISRHISCR